MKHIKSKIIINYNDIKSIKKAETQHNKNINKGLKLYETKQIGFNTFINTYI